MRKKNLARILMAWMLLVTFTSVLAIKGLHVHHEDCEQTEKAEHTHHAEVKASCFVCDFTMHKSSDVKTCEFIPVTIYAYIQKPQIFNIKLVYRTVESVNAHAPPHNVA